MTQNKFKTLQQAPSLPLLPVEPLISVITVSFNHAKFIERNIHSVLEQGWKNVEHIIVDGGSSDNTLEILKRYPHLDWTSAPDRGQSDALNKGFRRAKGDIIFWINSDDALAPGAFQAVLPLLKDSPVVMGVSQLTDETGIPTTQVKNIERDFFDFIKYWIPNASPAQPSVVFRKELLDFAARANGEYVDPELFYSMDLELWLRMAGAYPFAVRTDAVLSIYPVYKTAKTGGDWKPVYREMSRVFKRHERDTQSTAAELSVGIPVSRNSDTHELVKTIASLEDQNLWSFEIILFYDPAVTRKERKDIRASIPLSISERFDIREQVLEHGGACDAFKVFAKNAFAPYLLWTKIGQRFPSEFFLDLVKVFHEDRLGVVLFGEEDGFRDLSEKTQNYISENWTRLFQMPTGGETFAIRRLALKEREPFLSSYDFGLAIKELSIFSLFSGWFVRTYKLKNSGESSLLPKDLYRLLLGRGNALVSRNLEQIALTEPFHRIRLSNGFSFELPQDVYRCSKILATTAPENWVQVLCRGTLEELHRVGEQYPGFAGVWWKLCYEAELAGEKELANSAMRAFEEGL